jgi:hypothetical protein
LLFGGAAEGAGPGRRQVFKGSVGRDLAHLVTLGGVIDIAANAALILFHIGFSFLEALYIFLNYPVALSSPI